MFIPAIKKALSDPLCCTILFPVHDEAHWTLLELDRETSCWILYDSLYGRTRTGNITSRHKRAALTVVRNL